MPPDFEIIGIIITFSSAGILLSFSFWFARVLLCSTRKALIFSSWLVPCDCTFDRFVDYLVADGSTVVHKAPL